MPYFRVHDSHKLVLTNFKVMFTSFTETSNFTKIKRYKAYLLLKQNDTQVHFTVRDPYQKAISLYKDKFQFTPLNADLTKPVKWEKPQRIFFPTMGLSTKRDSDQKIQETLMNTSFDEFVQLLKKCYWRDEHTQPQHWILDHPRYLLFKKLHVNQKRLTITKWMRPGNSMPLPCQQDLITANTPTALLKSLPQKNSAPNRLRPSTTSMKTTSLITVTRCVRCKKPQKRTSNESESKNRSPG